MELIPCPFCGGEACLHNKGVFYWVECPNCGVQAKKYPVKRVAVEVWNHRTEPPNPPLALDELKRMGGKPVWIVNVSSINKFNGHWDICDWENGEVASFPYCMESRDASSYGITWLAYRRKPGEVTP